jgi:hypothetical protein
VINNVYTNTKITSRYLDTLDFYDKNKFAKIDERLSNVNKAPVYCVAFSFSPGVGVEFILLKKIEMLLNKINQNKPKQTKINQNVKKKLLLF